MPTVEAMSAAVFLADLMTHDAMRRIFPGCIRAENSVYRPQEDPMYVFTEDSPLGECNSTHTPTYSVSKISQEAAARLAARARHGRPGVRGAGADRLGLPSGVRGMPGVGWCSH